MKKGKVQTNDFNVNVLVEHEDSTNQHFSSLDVDVLCEKLSDEEIDIEFNKLVLSKKDKIEMLKKVKGFAISNCVSKNSKTPLFQATSCETVTALIYNFLKRCKNKKITNKSTPRSCKKKKSSV